LIAFFLATLSPPKKSLKNIFDFFVNGLVIFNESAGTKFSKKLFTKLEGGAIKEEVFDKFSFVPMKEGKNS